MRVLWFTNTPSLDAKYLNSKIIGGGWIGSLEAELSKIQSIELGISFKVSNEDAKPSTINNSTYLPINNKSTDNKFKKIFTRWQHKTEGEENIDRYLEIINQFKPEVIHIFGTESDFGLIIPRTKIPCIIHLQGNLTVINLKWFSGISAYEVFKYTNKWLLLRGYGLYHDYFLNRKAAEREKRIYKGCHYFMGRTEWDRRLSSVLSPESRYFHCDEIMRSEFYLHHWQQPQTLNEYRILTTIRNNIYKGLETVYETAVILQNNFPEYKITWEVVGILDMDEISAIINRKYKGRLNTNKIHFLGHLQENELISEMLKADLFVHPSHIDNSSNSVCEAMLLGMPIVATSAGGIPSLIHDKEEGLLVQDGDPYSMAGAINELITHRSSAMELGSSARKRAMIRHNPEKVVAELINIYSTVLSAD